jgi:glycosyltransferase involved in cell wall biosynthesis
MPDQRISIVLPCFNEGSGIIKLLQHLEEVLNKHTAHFFDVIIVDDCSIDNTLALLQSAQLNSKNMKLHILELLYNTGHQNCIYQGLLYTESLQSDFVVIMDSDGEDNPEAIPAMLEKADYDIVEVKRGKRSESFLFKVLNICYRLVFYIITGKKLHYGNFCMLSKNIVERLRLTSFIHLPAYLLKLKVKRTFVTFNRSKRIDGKSKMGYKNLLLHAFKSFVEFGDDLLLWFLRLFGIIILLLTGVGTNLLYQKFISHTAIPGWFSTIAMGLINICVLCIGFFVLGTLLINLMHNQNKSNQRIFKIIKGTE